MFSCCSVPSDTYSQAASNLVAGNNLEQTIQQIMDMGGGNWDKETVTRALRAAYNNPERAIDYLYSVSYLCLYPYLSLQPKLLLVFSHWCFVYRGFQKQLKLLYQWLRVVGLLQLKVQLMLSLFREDLIHLPWICSLRSVIVFSWSS